VAVYENNRGLMIKFVFIQEGTFPATRFMTRVW